MFSLKTCEKGFPFFLSIGDKNFLGFHFVGFGCPCVNKVCRKKRVYCLLELAPALNGYTESNTKLLWFYQELGLYC